MTVEIVEESPSALLTYATVPIAFEVNAVLDEDTLDDWRRGDELRAIPLDAPYTKDYDRYPGNHPMEWPMRFHMASWGFLGAYNDSARVGGAVIVVADKQIDLLEGQSDMALLWDLRVAPAARRLGVGRALLDRAEEWASGRGARWMRVETQQVNVPACRFYITRGFALEHIRRGAYADLPNEIQLLWAKRLEPPAPSG
jgi:ribosomal protein S18 acetylase RimI-like enzyme